jgi:hypothetical protein
VSTACLGAHHYLLGRAWVSCILHSTGQAYSDTYLQGIPVSDRPDLSGCLLSEGDDVRDVTEGGFGFISRSGDSVGTEGDMGAA